MDMATASSSRAASQILKQDVCQRYGWSWEMVEPSTSDDTEEKEWRCTVIVGPKDRRTFVSNESKLHVCQLALEGLKDVIQQEEAKPVVSDFADIFPEPVPVYESNEENWDYFWRHKPTAVGIDTEGNGRSPPVLVQISTLDYCIIESPRQHLSKNLQRLLTDTSIVKVFCDNAAHKDKKCLGLNADSESVVDLEALMAPIFGPVPTPRGLSRIVTLCMPELQVQIRKPPRNQRFSSSVGRFILIEQGKRNPLESIYDLSPEELQYAALDAWCTLQAYQRLLALATASSSTS
jgi:3'-5' exonuclease